MRCHSLKVRCRELNTSGMEHLKGRAKHLAGRVTGRDCGIIRVRLGKVDCVFVVTHGLRKVSE